MKTSYFTLGQSHFHRLSDGRCVDKDVVVKVVAENPRETITNLFGDKWCFEYQEQPDMRYFDSILELSEAEVNGLTAQFLRV